MVGWMGAGTTMALREGRSDQREAPVLVEHQWLYRFLFRRVDPPIQKLPTPAQKRCSWHCVSFVRRFAIPVLRRRQGRRSTPLGGSPP